MTLYCQCRCQESFLVELENNAECSNCTKQFCFDQEQCDMEVKLIETQCITRESKKDSLIIVLYLLVLLGAIVLALKKRTRM